MITSCYKLATVMEFWAFCKEEKRRGEVETSTSLLLVAILDTTMKLDIFMVYFGVVMVGYYLIEVLWMQWQEGVEVGSMEVVLWFLFVEVDGMWRHSSFSPSDAMQVVFYLILFFFHVVFVDHWSGDRILSMDWEGCDQHLCLLSSRFNWISLIFVLRNFGIGMHVLEFFAGIGVLKEKNQALLSISPRSQFILIMRVYCKFFPMGNLWVCFFLFVFGYKGFDARLTTFVGLEMVSPSSGIVYFMILSDGYIGCWKSFEGTIVVSLYYFFVGHGIYSSCYRCDPSATFMPPRKCMHCRQGDGGSNLQGECTVSHFSHDSAITANVD